ncbi:MAG: hypothetical protein KBS52_04145, partial [Clostridiales bacterium]|nr:hypothetical protein [Candidatus Equinaster intestinalis]
MKLKSVLKNDVFYFVVFASLTLLPLTDIFNYLRVAIMGVMFIFKCMNFNSISPNVRKMVLYMIMSPIIPILFVMIFDGGQVSWGIVIHEYMRLIFAAFAICTASKCRVSFKTVYIICACVLLFNLAIQILQKSGNSAVYNFIKTNYVQTDGFSHLDLSKDDGGNFRGGSIFVNPNVYMVIPLMCLGVFYQQKRIKDSVINMGLIAATLVSCYLTGSRTSIITAAAIIVVYYFVYDRNKLLLAIPIGGIALYFLMGSDISGSRAFRIDSAGSLDVKINGFIWYWRSANPLYWITGSLGSSRVYSIDCEWGHIYTWYGLFGYYWYIMYYKYARKNLKQLNV